MKVNYKGFKIEVYREESLGGWDALYYSIIAPDGYELDSGFEDSEENIRDKVEQLKEVVNDYLENYLDYREREIENDKY